MDELRCGGRELVEYATLIAVFDPCVLLICPGHQSGQSVPLGPDVLGVTIGRPPAAADGHGRADDRDNDELALDGQSSRDELHGLSGAPHTDAAPWIKPAASSAGRTCTSSTNNLSS